MDSEEVPIIDHNLNETEYKEKREIDENIYNLSLDDVLDQLEGIRFVFGKHIFRINYVNKGKFRFSAIYEGEKNE